MISVFPAIAVIAPLFLLMKTIGWLNSYQALIFPYTAFNLPFAIWIMRNYMLGIPKEMEETARIDGAGPFKTLWSVILPQARPGLFTAGIFTLHRLLDRVPDGDSRSTPTTTFRTIPVGIATSARSSRSRTGRSSPPRRSPSSRSRSSCSSSASPSSPGLTAGAVKG